MIEIYNLFVLVMSKDFDGKSNCYWMYLSQFKSMCSAIKSASGYQVMTKLPAEIFRVDYLRDGSMIYTITFEIQESGYLCNLHKRFYEVDHE